MMSVLSAVATGPWSRWGDFHGRRPLLFLTITGALLMQVSVVNVTINATVDVVSRLLTESETGS